MQQELTTTLSFHNTLLIFYRQQAGYTQVQLAQALDLPVAEYRAAEAGLLRLSFAQCAALEALLHIPASYLLIASLQMELLRSLSQLAEVYALAEGE